MQRLLDDGVPLAQLGVRAGTREEFDFAASEVSAATAGSRCPPRPSSA